MNCSKKIKTAIYLLIGVSIVACSDPDSPEIINQEEVITTMEVHLTPENGGPSVILSYRDLDGNGPNEPTIENGTLMANTSYVGEIVLLNETLSPPENVTEEVEEEAVDHQFFYSNTANLLLEYADLDENENPIGIAFNLQTGEPTSGSLTIVLRHEPDKFAMGVNEGQIENAGGETDITVTFGIVVE